MRDPSFNVIHEERDIKLALQLNFKDNPIFTFLTFTFREIAWQKKHTLQNH